MSLSECCPLNVCIFWFAESSIGAVEYIACILELLFCLVVESLFLFNTIHSIYKKNSFTTCKQTIESSPCGANHEGEAVNLSQLVIIQHYLNCLFHIHVSVGINSTSFSSTFYSKKWFCSVVLQMHVTSLYLLISAEPHRSGRFRELKSWNHWCETKRRILY